MCLCLQAVGFRVHVLGRLKSLTHLNGCQVTREESSAAVQQMAASHLSLTTLLDAACTTAVPPPSLSLLPVAEQLHHSRLQRVFQPATSATDWASKVSCPLMTYLDSEYLYGSGDKCDIM